MNFKSTHKFLKHLEVFQNKCQVVESEKKNKLMWASTKHVKFTLEKAELIFFKIQLRR